MLCMQIVVDSIGVSIYQMAATPFNRLQSDDRKEDSEFLEMDMLKIGVVRIVVMMMIK